MLPPFEDLPFFVQLILIISSVLTLVIGGIVVRRMIRAVLGKPLD